MDVLECSCTNMSLSILLLLSTFLPLSLEQGGCSTDPCLNGGTCNPGSRERYCLCPLGFLGDKCEIKRRIFCSESPCKNGGTCVSVDTGGYCVCKDNFWGTNCQLLLESPGGYTTATIISMAAGSTLGIVSLCTCVSYVNYKLCCDKPRPIKRSDLDEESTIMDA